VQRDKYIPLPLFAQLLLDPFRRRLHVVADTLLIDAVKKSLSKKKPADGWPKGK
jgi:hypothetical protein